MVAVEAETTGDGSITSFAAERAGCWAPLGVANGLVKAVGKISAALEYIDCSVVAIVADGAGGEELWSISVNEIADDLVSTLLGIMRVKLSG